MSTFEEGYTSISPSFWEYIKILVESGRIYEIATTNTYDLAKDFKHLNEISKGNGIISVI